MMGSRPCRGRRLPILSLLGQSRARRVMSPNNLKLQDTFDRGPRAASEQRPGVSEFSLHVAYMHVTALGKGMVTTWTPRDTIVTFIYILVLSRKISQRATMINDHLHLQAHPRKRRNSQAGFEGLELKVDESHNYINAVASHDRIPTRGIRIAAQAELPDEQA